MKVGADELLKMIEKPRKSVSTDLTQWLVYI
jgi:hypothetical protein